MTWRWSHTGCNLENEILTEELFFCGGGVGWRMFNIMLCLCQQPQWPRPIECSKISFKIQTPKLG